MIFLFLIGPAISHYNATFKLANDLKRKGYDIVYGGDEEFKDLVISQGFVFYQFESIIFPSIKREQNRHGGKIKLFINNILSLINQNREAEIDYRIMKFRNMFKHLRPDVLILDAFFTSYFLLLNYNVRTIVIQTYFSTRKGRDKPPLNSHIIPSYNVYSRILISLAWSKSLVRQKVRHLWEKFYYLNQDNLTILLRKDKQNRNIYKIIANYNCSFHFFLEGVPELILAPEEIDFPGNLEKSQYLIGSSVDLFRKHLLIDSEFWLFLNRIIEKRELEECVVIYCSFGTLNKVHYANCESFFNKVIEVAEKREWYLILSVGKEVKIKNLNRTNPKIYISESIPQLEVLKYCDVIITHGGINTIKESIIFSVPMLVYPLNSEWDQNGNAARIVFHKIGLRGNIEKDNKAKIERRINTLLYDQNIKENLKNIGKQVRRCNEESYGAHIVEEIVNSNKF